MGVVSETKTTYIKTLERALDESLKLQSHYAELLNIYDGGHRKIFKTKEAWINRLEETMGYIK
jgi:tRNA U55 pseudouridine synthase TruB